MRVSSSVFVSNSPEKDQLKFYISIVVEHTFKLIAMLSTNLYWSMEPLLMIIVGQLTIPAQIILI